MANLRNVFLNIRLRWASDFIKAGQLRVQLVHSLKLTRLICLQMWTWHPDCKQQLSNTECIFWSLIYSITSWHPKLGKYAEKLTESQWKALTSQSGFIQLISRLQAWKRPMIASQNCQSRTRSEHTYVRRMSSGTSSEHARSQHSQSLTPTLSSKSCVALLTPSSLLSSTKVTYTISLVNGLKQRLQSLRLKKWCHWMDHVKHCWRSSMMLMAKLLKNGKDFVR